MQFPTILFKTLAIAGIVAAAPLAPLSQPSAELVARQASNTTTSGTTQLTFTGAGASFSVTASVNGQEFSIRKCVPCSLLGGFMRAGPDVPDQNTKQPWRNTAGLEGMRPTDRCLLTTKLETANAISIDFIAQVGTASCSFTGVDRARLTVVGANSGATLAPPQTVATGLCE